MVPESILELSPHQKAHRVCDIESLFKILTNFNDLLSELSLSKKKIEYISIM